MKIKKREKFEQPKDYTNANGERIVFHYNREERLKKSIHQNKFNNCFFCKKNMPFLITMINFILVFVLLMLFYRYVGRLDLFKDESGLQYFISHKTVSKSSEFLFQIKNISKKNVPVTNDKFLFEVLNSDNETIYYQPISIYKKEFRINEFYSENIVIDKPPKGSYIAQVYLDMSATPKKIEIKFDIK